VRELYISFGPKWAPNKWFGLFFMKFEVWERWISITGGAGTAFPCVQWHFNHWRYDLSQTFYQVWALHRWGGRHNHSPTRNCNRCAKN